MHSRQKRVDGALENIGHRNIGHRSPKGPKARFRFGIITKTSRSAETLEGFSQQMSNFGDGRLSRVA
jgi:hypothetical protein